MRFLLSALILMTGSAAFAGTACEDYVKSTDDLLVLTRDRFNRGEVTRTDVASVEIAALQAKYACNLAPKKDYCAAAVGAAKVYRDRVLEESRVGQRSTDDIITAEKAVFAIRSACE